jgi:hypothetical protein
VEAMTRKKMKRMKLSASEAAEILLKRILREALSILLLERRKIDRKIVRYKKLIAAQNQAAREKLLKVSP